jgi:hypothetical protein
MEDYINLDDLISHNTYYQFDIQNQNLTLNAIGEGTNIGDFLIKDELGKNKDYILTSSIFYKKQIEKNKFIPLINVKNENSSYSIGVIIYEDIQINKNIEKFDVFFVYNQPTFKIYKLNKNINHENIIEMLFECIFNLNIDIF